jgi:maltose alpha-D-glucosyltransferase/alpha-amylase
MKPKKRRNKTIFYTHYITKKKGMETKDKETNILNTPLAWAQFWDDSAVVQTLLARVLPTYLPKCRWFGGKSKKLKQYKVQYTLPFPFGGSLAYLIVLDVSYVSASSESYFLPLYFSQEEDIKKLDKKAVITPLTIAGKAGHLIDAIYDDDFREAIFTHILGQKKIHSEDGTLSFERGNVLDGYKTTSSFESKVLKVDQSNTSVIFEDRFFFKIYRKLFREQNPDVEITRFLTENGGFEHSPRYAGSLTWKREGFPDVSLGLMQEKVENDGDAWAYFHARVKSYFEKVQQLRHDIKEIKKVELYKPLSIRDIEPEMLDLIGYETLKSVEKLAQRTAEMHVSISSDRSNYTFLPITFNEDYSVWLKNKLILQLERRAELVEKNIDSLEGLALEYAKIFLEREEDIMNIIQTFDESKMIGKRIRIHGDYHLGQVLRTGDDFVILDFEGEPESTIRDRKVKQSPLKDVAGLIRSFHYAVYSNIFEIKDSSNLPFNDLVEAGSLYYRSVVAVFLNTYLDTAQKNSLAIGYDNESRYLLCYHLLEKAIYELGYEMNSRPAWALIPFKGILNLLDSVFS